MTLLVVVCNKTENFIIADSTVIMRRIVFRKLMHGQLSSSLTGT